MKTKDFNYALPPDLIAQEPASERDQARMMVVRRLDGTLEHRQVRDLPEYLQPGDLLVANDTRVIPARVFGQKVPTGGQVELLLIEEKDPGIWDVLLRARRRPKPGSEIILGGGQARAILLEDGAMGRAMVRIECEGRFLDHLETIGVPPLPPYIHRKTPDPGQEAADRIRYQTVFARVPGAIAAPTAGLHFTENLLREIEAMGARRTTVTLHVGIGTFRPVTAENVEDHAMDPERYVVTTETAAQIRACKAERKRVIAVGSTTVRTLEYAARETGEVGPGEGRADLFIFPPYRFQVVDALLTNFHLPQSTLLMMICALAGRDPIMRAYAEAVRERYRFFSYGDCMLIL